jgi:hypothetical protein
MLRVARHLVSDTRLTPKDKKVIYAFVNKDSAQSNKLITDGKVLDGLWMGGNNIANWDGSSISLNETGGRSAQTIHRYIGKLAPKSWLRYGRDLTAALDDMDDARMRRQMVDTSFATFDRLHDLSNDFKRTFKEWNSLKGETDKVWKKFRADRKVSDYLSDNYGPGTGGFADKMDDVTKAQFELYNALLAMVKHAEKMRDRVERDRRMPGRTSSRRVGRLVKRHEKLLDKWAESSEGQRFMQRGAIFYDDLPQSLRSQLERIKDTETLWSDVERYLGDIHSAGHSFVKPMGLRWSSDRQAADNRWWLSLGYQYSTPDGGLYGDNDEFTEKYDSIEEMFEDRGSWAEIKDTSRHWDWQGGGDFETEFEQDDAEFRQFILHIDPPGRWRDEDIKKIKNHMKKIGLKVY